MSLQLFAWLESPVQLCPPLAGVGLLQSLLLDWEPVPHVLLHVVQADHKSKPPSTAEWNKDYNYDQQIIHLTELVPAGVNAQESIAGYSQWLSNLDKVRSKISPSLCRYQRSFSRHSLGAVECTALFFLKWFLLIFHMFENTVSKEPRNSIRRQQVQLKYKISWWHGDIRACMSIVILDLNELVSIWSVTDGLLLIRQ